MADLSSLRVAIIGAGIAGLGTAIALKSHPAIDVQIYERATELKEIGASIALGPNGMRTLDRLGVENALDDSIAFRNKSKLPMIYRHYLTDEVVSVDRNRCEVEYGHQTSRFYRAHLQEALVQQVDPSQIHLSRPFSSVKFDNEAQELVITFGDGSTAVADVILGADGIHSRVRTQFAPSSRTAWTGWTTFRSVFPIEPHLSHIVDLPDEALHIWGLDRTLFISRLGRGLFTVVGSSQSDPQEVAMTTPDGSIQPPVPWNSDGDVTLLRDYYRDWSPLVRSIVEATPHTRVYPNTTAHALDSWALGDGRVTLAGDAAHAHGGAFAAGGSLALDDAWAFAAALTYVFPAAACEGGPSSSPSSNADGVTTRRRALSEAVSRALRLYERTRKAHTDRVMRVVAQGNAKRVERCRTKTVETDEQLRERMKGRPDTTWIHEHDVVAAFASAVNSDGGQTARGDHANV